MRNTFINKITEMAQNNKKIMVVTADLGYSVLEGFRDLYPSRYFNVGISEQAMASIAGGMALEGNIVITYSIGNFSTLRCIEQIRNDICYHNANVKIVSVGGGFSYGQLGMSHHATEDIAMMRTIPGMKVLVPSDPEEAAAAADYVINTDGPCYIRLAKNREPKLYDKTDYKLDKMYRLTSGNGKAALISCGPVLKNVISAAETLESENIITDIYSSPCVSPLDTASLKKIIDSYDFIFTVEEHNVTGGLGGAVAEVISGCPDRKAVIHRLGLQNCFASIVGDHDYLCEQYGISDEKIANTVRGIMVK